MSDTTSEKGTRAEEPEGMEPPEGSALIAEGVRIAREILGRECASSSFADEWEERAFEKAEFGVLRVYVNRRTGEVRFNLEDVARCLGLSEGEALEALDVDGGDVSAMPQRRITESDYERFCRELEG